MNHTLWNCSQLIRVIVIVPTKEQSMFMTDDVVHVYRLRPTNVQWDSSRKIASN